MGLYNLTGHSRCGFFNAYTIPISIACPSHADLNFSVDKLKTPSLHWHPEEVLEEYVTWFSGYVAELKGTGPRGVRGVKGKQKEWIRQHVLEKFVEEFNEQGTNVDLLLKVRLLIV